MPYTPTFSPAAKMAGMNMNGMDHSKMAGMNMNGMDHSKMAGNEEIEKKLNSAVFPGAQGGPLMHVIAAKAVCSLTW